MLKTKKIPSQFVKVKKIKRQYKYGDCIPESIKEYNRLIKKGLKPKLVEGWVEVKGNNTIDILPDMEALNLYYCEIANNIYDVTAFNNITSIDYPKLLSHTWLILDNKYIDITKNQFDKYGGIIRYFEKERYWYDNNLTIEIKNLKNRNKKEYSIHDLHIRKNYE